MKLLVDHRERPLANLLQDVYEEIAFAQLPVGDYLLVSDSTAVVVERKTVTDFMSSVRSNRLWDQLLRMMKAEMVLGHEIKRKILLLHGNFQDYLMEVNYENPEDMLKHWSQLMGAYLEIIYVYNTPIVHAESDIAFKAFMSVHAFDKGCLIGCHLLACFDSPHKWRICTILIPIFRATS